MTDESSGSNPRRRAKSNTRPKARPAIDYQALRQELDTILDELQREDLTVDAALARYRRGLELVQQLELYLETAENTVTELKAAFDAKSS